MKFQSRRYSPDSRRSSSNTNILVLVVYLPRKPHVFGIFYANCAPICLSTITPCKDFLQGVFLFVISNITTNESKAMDINITHKFKKNTQRGSFGVTLLPLFLAMAGWQLTVYFTELPAFILPSPADVGTRFEIGRAHV